MVTHFVGDHIGLCEITGSLEALGHFLEEAHVQINLLVGRAIERPTGRRGETASGIDLATKQHQGWVLIVAPGLLENLAPRVFGVAQYRAYELGLLIVGRWCVPGLLGDLRRGLLGQLTAQLPQNLHRVLAGQQTKADNHYHGHQAQAFAAPDSHPAAAPGALIAHVFHIVATSTFFPKHEGILR